MDQCEEEPRRAFDRAVTDLTEVRQRHANTAAESEWDWRAVWALILVAVPALLLSNGLPALGTALVVTAATFAFLYHRGTAAWFNLRQCLLAGGWAVIWAVQRIHLGRRAVQWGEALREVTDQSVPAVARRMLGDDPDSVLLPDDFLGLRALQEPGYLVDTEAWLQLRKKLSQTEYGTIAVCGPRGSGKSTLLRACVEKAGFGILAQAPATYTPQDFLLALSVRLCETYLRKRDRKVPEFVRLSPLVRLTRSLTAGTRRLARWSAFALPAAALLSLGLGHSVRSLFTEYAGSVTGVLGEWAGGVRDDATDIWQGRSTAASVTVAVVGIAWWALRRSTGWRQLTGLLWWVVRAGLGSALIYVCIMDVINDRQQLQPLLEAIPAGTILTAFVLLFLFGLCLAASESEEEFQLGTWKLPVKQAFERLAAVTGTGLLVYLLSDPYVSRLLADAQNPLRLAILVVGCLLFSTDWKPRPADSLLVTRCRDHLYRLQTVQTSGHTLTSGASQVLSLGTSHATSVSTVPLNFPELVEDFRELLAQIAHEEERKGDDVVIAIDEVDRLGSEAQARAFLAEIKAILGVPHVYYLIAVSEDVGAAFTRRGLPHRDVTDSSLDDVIHVQPSTLKESRRILVERAKTLTGPYATLAHALSGGVLRDLLRYGLQIREMQEKAGSFELTDISRHLIMKELSETLAGFGILVSKHPWTPETSNVLTTFRSLVRDVREPCQCIGQRLRTSLERFAFHGAADPADTTTRPALLDGAREIIEEASAYVYFSMTLLDIFSTEGLERRTRRAAEQGAAGDPERLAEARRELGISPYSARMLIDSVRTAWSLPLAPTPRAGIPAPRPEECAIHRPHREEQPT
ncbi:hypothetical protein [Streptomyces sp. NPDC086023]|uniref:hypothetical protein n=1 Tax=Streptomyces sp. NPDC086023 TaxID=3365746 RepID=UPI0037CEEE6A